MEQSPHVLQVMYSLLVAGQTTTGRPWGVVRFLTFTDSEGRTATTGNPCLDKRSACLRLFPERLITKPSRVAARIAFRLSAVGGLWVYVKPLVPRAAFARRNKSRAFMRSPLPGRSPACPCLHKVPGRIDLIFLRKEVKLSPLLPSVTFFQCIPRKEFFA